MRFVTVLACAVVLLASRAAVAKYDPPSLSERVFGAEVIVVGRIDALHEKDYDLRVEEWLAGAKKSETLRIERFEDWACARRDPPYAAGQRLVAFLKQGGDGWTSIGGGCEGEVILDGGVAHVRSVPTADYDSLGPISETRFRAAIRSLLSGYRDIGAPGYVDAWRGLLRNDDPWVAATALERLDVEAVVNPQPASAFADELTGLVARPERGLRLLAAHRFADWLGPWERVAVAKRLAEASQTARAGLRPAAALGRMSLAPTDPQRHADLLRLLADETVPLEERDAVAGILADGVVTVPRDIALTAIDPAAREAVACVRDPALLLHLCAYLGRLRGIYEWPRPNDAELERAKWLQILDAPAPKTRPAPAVEPPPKDDPYLSPTERAVFVPRDAEERPFIARLVRAVRRARNAQKAGDVPAALDSYRDALSAEMVVRDSMRPVLLGLGVDLEEVGRTARALLEPK